MAGQGIGGLPSNLLADLPPPGPEEDLTLILERHGLRIERIVSHGHVTPPDRPYRQDGDEWVLLLSGGARLWLDEEGEVALGPGDHLLIPAGRLHRVVWTDPEKATVWLAVHMSG
jgi:cupin 2 domain-containing protein